jgi:predicted peptidase
MSHMKRRTIPILTATALAAALLAGCVESSTQTVTTEEGPGQKDGKGGGAMGQGGGNEGAGSAGLDKSSDTELQEMLENVQDKYKQDTWTDEEKGLTVDYNIYVPDGYAGDCTLPIVFFIGDATTAENDVSCSLTQGWGGIVWATDEVQEKNYSCLVVTLVFPEVVLDDHGSCTTTDYLDAVPEIITDITEKYGADRSRIYGTGQSMGAMTTLYTAARNPDLYAGVLIVDGQWDISTLSGLKDVNLLYITAAGDESATDGQTEVKEMLTDEGLTISSVTDLDAFLADDASTKQELEDAVSSMLAEGSLYNFINWKAGSVLTAYGGNGSEHMAAFDYGYKLAAVRDWLFAQR